MILLDIICHCFTYIKLSDTDVFTYAYNPKMAYLSNDAYLHKHYERHTLKYTQMHLPNCVCLQPQRMNSMYRQPFGTLR